MSVASQLNVPHTYDVHATRSLELNERKKVGRARDHVRDGGRRVGVFYAVTNQIAHYHAVEN